jgi:chitin disaccharide deacetylase
MKTLLIFLTGFAVAASWCCGQDPTYAERLGYPNGARVLILHVDDVGMSFDSNQGAMEAMTNGVATSCSVMMPCPWVPAYVHYLKQNPQTDAGLHLTLTSEWVGYRWGPVAGKATVPGLVDQEGAMWKEVEQVAKHASPDEVEKEIRAQLDRAKTMGFEPTHLDTHMGTVFATPAFLERYIKVGIENHIPIMLPGGHDSLIQAETHGSEEQLRQMRALGKALWDAGLPVLDDLHNVSYDWHVEPGATNDDKKMVEARTSQYLEGVKSLKPGVTMMIMHCTAPTEVFQHISGSGPARRGDLLVMTNPDFKRGLQQEKIVLTTWRELMKRRTALKQNAN